MRELLRSNDLVLLSAVQAALSSEGIPCVEFDGQTANLYGGVIAVERRLMVDDDDLRAAQEIVRAISPEHMP